MNRSEIPLTALLADWIASTHYEDLPPQAVRFATDAITDCVGVALAGTREPLGPILLSTIGSGTDSSGRGSHLLGTSRRAGAADAALFNGTVSHALDYDDINHPAYAHPSAHLMPTLFALAEGGPASGRDIILAYAVGFELHGKFGRSLNVGEGIPHLAGHYARGWHPTGTFGALSSAGAGARLLGLDAGGIRRALGVAGTAACGLRASFGTMSKPLNAGLAARNGVLAAQLGAAGFTSAEDILEDRFGFMNVLSDGGWSAKPFHDLGSPWEITTEYGLALKPYPACGATHPAIEAALAARAEIGGGEIEGVYVGHNEVMPSVLVYDDPRTPLEGKFSMQFCIAAALATGCVNIATFNDAMIADPRIRSLIGKMEVRVDERVRLNPEHGAVVKVRLRSGREIEKLVELAKGKPARWMSRSDLFEKFNDCSEATLGRTGALGVFELLQSLPSLPTIAPVVAALEAAVGARCLGST